MERTLVLGGSGFIGAHLTAALARDGGAVTAVARRFRRPPEPGVSHRGLDLYACSLSELHALVDGAETIYHLAWSTFAASAEQDPARDLQDNAGFFVRLLDVLKGTGARIVFCSSGGTVYGARDDGRPIPETAALRPLGAYGAGKVVAESYAEMFRRAYGLDVRVARLANPYGVGQDPGRLQGALTRFVSHAVKAIPIEIWGDGSAVRDYLHVDDAVAALQRLGGASREALGETPVFNVGSGHGASLNALIAAIEARTGRALQVSYTPARQVDVAWNVLDIARIERELAWRPAISLHEGVERLVRDLSA